MRQKSRDGGSPSLDAHKPALVQLLPGKHALANPMLLGSREEKMGVTTPQFLTGQHSALAWPSVAWMDECGGGVVPF